MPERLGRAWRVLGTGLSFVAFGIGGVFLRLLVFPVLSLLVRDSEYRGRRARRIIQCSFGAFIELMRCLGVLTYEVHGRDRLQRRGLLVLANHPTLIDVVFLVSLIPDADCVVKSRLATNPFTRGPINAAGYISNDNGAELVTECIASVRSGKNLVIFPEATRTPAVGTSKMQRGAANIAVRGMLSVTPVRISCTPRTLAKGQPWYLVPSRRFHVVIRVGEDLSMTAFVAGTTPAIASRRLTEHLIAYFAME